MLGKIICVILVLSVVSAAFTGNLSALAPAALEGASSAVDTVISLCGMMCLWSGILRVLTAAGGVSFLAKLFSPILSRLFPDAFNKNCGKEEITSCIAANVLGVGNAATPFALSAFEKTDKLVKSGNATDDMIMLTALSCAPFSVFPTTVVTLRQAAGSDDPFSVIVPVWIVSLLSSVLTVILCKICAKASK